MSCSFKDRAGLRVRLGQVCGGAIFARCSVVRPCNSTSFPVADSAVWGCCSCSRAWGLDFISSFVAGHSFCCGEAMWGGSAGDGVAVLRATQHNRQKFNLLTLTGAGGSFLVLRQVATQELGPTQFVYACLSGSVFSVFPVVCRWACSLPRCPLRLWRSHASS